MSELHPEAIAERIRCLGIACQCCNCRGSDEQINVLIAEYVTDQQAEIGRLRKEMRECASTLACHCDKAWTGRGLHETHCQHGVSQALLEAAERQKGES